MREKSTILELYAKIQVIYCLAVGEERGREELGAGEGIRKELLVREFMFG